MTNQPKTRAKPAAALKSAAVDLFVGPPPVYVRIDGASSVLGLHKKPEVVEWNGKSGVGVIQKRYCCPRCGGAGRSEAWAYTGYVCYECGGRGTWMEPHTHKLYTAEASAKLDSTQAKRKATRDAKQAAARQERLDSALAAFDGWKSEHAEALERIEKMGTVTGYEWVFGWENLQTILSCLAQKTAPARAWLVESATKTATTVARLVAENEAKRAAGWIGKVGDKVEVTVTLRNRLDRQISEYPTIWSHLHIMETAGHETVVYRGSKVLGGKGDTLVIKAAIKALDEYEGVKQTVIQRPKVLEAPATAET